MTRAMQGGWGAATAILCALLAGCGRQPVAVAPADAGGPSAMARANPTAGNIEHVTVKATGEGRTVSAAVDSAIRLAIEQVNGKAMQASTQQLVAGGTFSLGDHKLDVGAAAFSDFVRTRTGGVVTDFKLLSHKRSLLSSTEEVEIEARVAKFARPASANRIRVAVAPLRSKATRFVVDRRSFDAREIEQELRGRIIESLAQTGRFAVLDRDFSAEVDAELDQIADGATRSEDLARLGQQLAADYVLVGRIEELGYERHERQLRTSDRKLVWHSGGATLSYRLVNVATRQIELSDRVTVGLPKTAATTLVSSASEIDTREVITGLTNRLSEQAGRKVGLQLFPITVVAVQGDEVVLSQGGSSVTEGRDYDVVLRGQQLKDPQTGQVIGRSDSPCCVVRVSRVTPDLSYAQVLSKNIDMAASFAPGAMELRERAAVLPKPLASTRRAEPDDDFDDESPVTETIPVKETKW